MSGVADTIAINGFISLSAFTLTLLLTKLRFKRKVYGLCIPFGKTMVCDTLSNDNIYFVDCDDWCKKNFKDYDELIKNPNDYIVNVLKPLSEHVLFVVNNISKMKNKKIVLVSHSLELLKALRCNDKNIKVYLPSSELLNKLSSNGGVVISKEVADRITQLKFNILLKKVDAKVYNTMDDLQSMIKNKFKLAGRFF